MYCIQVKRNNQCVGYTKTFNLVQEKLNARVVKKEHADYYSDPRTAHLDADAFKVLYPSNEYCVITSE